MDAKRAKMLEKELVGPLQRQGPPDQVQVRLARYEEMAAEADKARKIDAADINIPPGLRPVTSSSRPSTPPGLRGPGAVGTTSPHPSRVPASSASSAPTASARPRCSG